MIANSLNMGSFSLPAGVMARLHPVIPRATPAVPFDIYNYEFLFNDPATVKLIRNGLTIGCFYIESPGMRNLLKKLQVDTFEMLTAASSVIRPGVAESGMMQQFIQRHHDPSKRQYLVPQMEEVLGDTYGVMIYQEDVIKVVHHIAGLSLEEADLLRRAMSGKMRSHSAMQVLTDKFYVSCKAKGLEEATARELWRQVESFAGYSFCKAHSASFALLSYQVAFLKAHYPAEFISSVLTNQGGFYSPAVYVQEAKRMGLKVELPCINKSMYEYTGDGDTIRIGLLAVKSFQRAYSDIIIEERKKHGPFRSLPDFLVRTKTGYESIVMLIKCGAMDCFNETRPALLRMLDVYFRKMKVQDESYNDLFMNESFALLEDIKTTQDYSIEERCLAEYQSFDYMVSRHPLNFYSEWINHPSVVPAASMHKYHGKKIKMIGWYMTSKRIMTRKGDIMKFLSLEDLTGTFEAVIFPNVYSSVAERTLSMGPYVVEGRVDDNNLIVSHLSILSEKDIKVQFRYDTAENAYKPDDERTGEEDFRLAASIDVEKLRRAYVA
jgi:DNA polymerase III alpha subunit